MTSTEFRLSPLDIDKCLQRLAELLEGAGLAVEEEKGEVVADCGRTRLAVHLNRNWLVARQTWLGRLYASDIPAAQTLAWTTSSERAWPVFHVRELAGKQSILAQATVIHPMVSGDATTREAQLRAFLSAALASGVELATVFGGRFPGRDSSDTAATVVSPSIGGTFAGMSRERLSAWGYSHPERKVAIADNGAEVTYWIGPQKLVVALGDSSVCEVRASTSLGGRIMQEEDIETKLRTAYEHADGDKGFVSFSFVDSTGTPRLVAKLVVPVGAGLSDDQLDFVLTEGGQCTLRALASVLQRFH